MVRTAVEGGTPVSAAAAGLARLAELADLEDEESAARWLAATLRDLMAAIRATGFSGWVTHEFIPTRDPIASLGEAVRICSA